MDEDFNDKLKLRTGRIDIEPFPRPLYTSKDRLSPFLFSRFDIAPYAFILAFGDLEFDEKKNRISGEENGAYHGPPSGLLVESISNSLCLDLLDEEIDKLFVNGFLYINA